MKKVIVEALLSLDLEKVRLINNDKVFCIPRKDYIFGFMINPSKEDSKLIEKNRLKEDFKEEEGKIKEESTKAHMLVKSKEELAKLDEKYNKLLKDARERYQKNVLGFL